MKLLDKKKKLYKVQMKFKVNLIFPSDISFLIYPLAQVKAGLYHSYKGMVNDVWVSSLDE